MRPQQMVVDGIAKVWAGLLDVEDAMNGVKQTSKMGFYAQEIDNSGLDFGGGASSLELALSYHE